MVEPTTDSDSHSKPDIIRPVGGVVHRSSRSSNRLDFKNHRRDWLMTGLCAILAGLAWLGSAVFFAGFVENDRGVTHLLAAFITAFGLGAFAYGPLMIIGFFAWQAAKKRRPLTLMRAIIALLLILPWGVLGVFLWPLGGLARGVGVISVFMVVVTAIWAFKSLRTAA